MDYPYKQAETENCYFIYKFRFYTPDYNLADPDASTKPGATFSKASGFFALHTDTQPGVQVDDFSIPASEEIVWSLRKS